MTKRSEDLITYFLELSRLFRKGFYSKQEGVNFFQMYSLSLIDEAEHITMKELAQGLNITSSSATALVDRLVRDNAVERVSDPKNRRLVCLKLTRKGKAYLVRGIAQKKRILHDMVSSLTLSEREELKRLMHKAWTAYRPH
jgi:DNA-binding MarR family transcriptional regulator